jgi:hypothetical protein
MTIICKRQYFIFENASNDDVYEAFLLRLFIGILGRELFRANVL